MGANKSRISAEDYDEWSSYLNALKDGVGDIKKSYKSHSDFYAQFETEDAYKSYNRQQKYSGMSYTDVQKEIGNLKKQHEKALMGGYDNEAELSDEIKWLDEFSRSRSVIETMTSDELTELKNKDKSINDNISALKKEKSELEDKRSRLASGSGRGMVTDAYKDTSERIAEIDKQINYLEGTKSSQILYYDDDGVAVTVDNLLYEKNAKEHLSSIEDNPNAKFVYDMLVSSEDDLDKLDTVFVPQTEEDQQILDELCSKYGVDISDQMHVDGLAQLETLRAAIQNEISGKSVYLSTLGYDWDFLSDYRKILKSKEEYVENKRKDEQFAIDYPTAATIFSIVGAPLQIADYAGNILNPPEEYNVGGNIVSGITNIYDDRNINRTQTYNDTVTQLFEDWAREGTNSELAAWLASNTYSGITSSMQSLLVGATSRAIFGAGAGDAIALGIMGSTAASSSFNSAVKNGATHGQAFMTSAAQGLSEALFEKVSLDSYFSKFKVENLNVSSLAELLKGTAKNTWLQALAESSEETATEIFNTIADNMINGDLSEYYISVDKYEKQGYSRSDAEKMASTDWLLGVMSAAYGGAIGGATSSTLGTMTNVAVNAPHMIDTAIENNMEYEYNGEGITSFDNIDVLLRTAQQLNDKKINRLVKKVASAPTENLTERQQAKANRKVGRLYDEILDKQQKKLSIRRKKFSENMSSRLFVTMNLKIPIRLSERFSSICMSAV